MKGIDMRAQTKKFYHDYYHYRLSNHQAQAILNGDN